MFWEATINSFYWSRYFEESQETRFTEVDILRSQKNLRWLAEVGSFEDPKERPLVYFSKFFQATASVGLLAEYEYFHRSNNQYWTVPMKYQYSVSLLFCMVFVSSREFWTELP